MAFSRKDALTNINVDNPKKERKSLSVSYVKEDVFGDFCAGTMVVQWEGSVLVTRQRSMNVMNDVITNLVASL